MEFLDKATMLFSEPNQVIMLVSHSIETEHQSTNEKSVSLPSSVSKEMVLVN